MIAILLAAFLAQAQAAEPARGAIHGRVVDKDTGRPLARAIVLLSGSDGAAGMRSTTTDERGAFTFGELRPGRYGGLITARQHKATSLESGPAGLTVTANAPLEVTVALPRTHAITVRVVDAFGEPLSRVTVRPIAFDTGRASFQMWRYSTDDLGRLRLFDLPPGRYALCAEGGGITSEGSAARGDRLLPTCYPSTDEDNAEPVRVGASDVDGIEIRMRRGRTFTIAGTVIDAAGAPAAGAQLMLEPVEANRSGGTSVHLDASGNFTILHVRPGAYALAASAGGDPESLTSRPKAAAAVDLRVVDADLDDLVIALETTVNVEGRIVLEDPSATPPPMSGSGFWIDPRTPAEHLAGRYGWNHAVARPDRTFTLESVSGPRVLDFENAPRGWYVKLVRYDGREIMDTPTEFKGGAGAPPLEVVLSNRGAVVTGTVTDDVGAPAGANVYLFRITSTNVIRVASARSSSTRGTFTLGPVRGGEYVVVALPSESDVQPNAAQSRLARLAALGERVTLTDLDERSVQLRVVRER